MKKAIIYLFFLQTAMFLSSCSDNGIFFANDEVEVKTYDLTNFNELEVSDNFKVFVQFGPVEQIEIKVNKNIVRHLSVRKDGNQLEIKLKPGVAVWGKETLEAHITMKELVDVDLSGNSSLQLLDVLQSNKLVADVSGNSKLLGELDLDNLDLESSGNSRVDLEGTVGEIDLDLSGNSRLEGTALSTDVFHGDFSGNSRANLTINNSIYIEASGNSRLTYSGDASIEFQDLSGLSKIIKN